MSLFPYLAPITVVGIAMILGIVIFIRTYSD